MIYKELTPKIRGILMSQLFILCMLAGFSLHAQCPTVVWGDEFTGTSLDLNKWTPQIGDGCDIGLCGWGNNELQYYKAENATVSNGTLKITAKKERVKSKQYTSARLRTINKGDWTYGRFEARIKLPYGQGFWPAFWMLPTDEVYGGWPQSGEIDIMELVGHEPNRVHGTIHYGDPYPNNQFQGNSFTLNSGIFNDDFHTFAIEWAPGIIRWYVDDYLYSTKTAADLSPFNWPFDQRFHFLLNLAVGGNWPGSPDATSVFPQTMEVDYVRVYDGNFPHATGKRVVTYQAQGEVYSLANVPSGASVSWSVPAGATIISGQSTNSITVNWGTTGGDVIATVNASCYTRQIKVNVLVEPAFVKEFSFENFDQSPNMTLISATGTLTEDVANPAPNTVNNSALCGRYVRNSNEQYDVLQYSTTMITDASAYVNNQKKFSIDVYTNAPPGTLILLQLENSATATSSNYPTGRHSRYQAFTSVQNQWQRLTFTLLDRPDGGVPNNAVNRLVFLYASNSFTGNTYHWDNFDSYAVAGANQPPTVSITAPTDGTTYNSLQTITINANASDSDGSVSQVEFFVNGSSVGTDNSSPYSINWTIPAFGNYQLTARATDNNGANTASAPVNISASSGSPSYCASQGTSFNNEWIASVAVGSFSNSSGKAGYSDFTGLTANLSTGAHSLTLTPGYSGPSRNEYWRIWIDYNVDGDFNDAGELAFDAGSAQSGTKTGTLTIPTSAAGVTTRMRISMKRDAAPGSCETFARGEVEDYTISIGGSALQLPDNSTTAGFENLLVFPNPASQYLQVFNGLNEQITGFVVFDLNGRELLRHSVELEKGDSLQLDIALLARGIYLLRSSTASGKIETQRFVKF